LKSISFSPLLGDHRVPEFVVLVIILNDRAGKGLALGHAVALGEGTSRDVADHHLDRHDLDLAHELLAHVETADEMGGNADILQPHHQVFGNAVVEDALAGDHALLLGIEGGRIVLEILHQRAGFGTLVEDLRLAFVDLLAAGHFDLDLAPELGRGGLGR